MSDRYNDPMYRVLHYYVVFVLGFFFLRNSFTRGLSLKNILSFFEVGIEKQTDDSETNEGAVAGGVVSILVVLALVGVVGVIYRR